jgi:hypothetical protein
MNRPKRLFTVFVVVAIATVAGCAPRGLTFYDVERTRREQCAIRSNGEFCVEPEQFDPPLIEAWAIDLGDDADVLYVDQEAWVLDPLRDGEDPRTTSRTATRRQVIATGDALCTTTELRSVEFVADGRGLTGTYRASSRLEGPPACGATPVGERFVEDLAGLGGTP